MGKTLTKEERDMIPFKYALTPEEMAVLSGICKDKIYAIIHANVNAGYIIRNGNRYLLRRAQFLEFLDTITAI